MGFIGLGAHIRKCINRGVFVGNQISLSAVKYDTFLKLFFCIFLKIYWSAKLFIGLETLVLCQKMLGLGPETPVSGFQNRNFYFKPIF